MCILEESDLADNQCLPEIKAKFSGSGSGDESLSESSCNGKQKEKDRLCRLEN